jgi:hypothetical protein
VRIALIGCDLRQIRALALSQASTGSVRELTTGPSLDQV